MAGTTTYGDITPRTAGHVVRELLERGFPHLCFEKWGQAKPLSNRSTKTMIWRRYLAFNATPKTLAEGVTPKMTQLRKVDVQTTLVQLGDGTTISDVVADTHEDPVMQEAIDILGEQAAIMVEKFRFNILKAGTSVFYSNGTARTSVNTKITTSLQRRITRQLDRLLARKITRAIASTARFDSASIPAAYVALHHTDVSNDVRDMFGFKDTVDYGGGMVAMENETGNVESVRYFGSQIMEPWTDAGGAYGGAVISTSGTSADVYPVLYIAKDAYGLVALKGQSALTPMVVNPKPSDSDPFAQRGHVTWKSMQGAVILNDDWMVRAEVAVAQ